MAIREPWKGWQRTAMPILSALILLNTLAIFMLSVLTAAAPDIIHDDSTNDARSPKSQARAQLIFFWCTIPLVLCALAASEMFSLWTARLRPWWILLSSTIAICLWTMQLVLWELCVRFPGSAAPGYCPWVYQTEGQIQNASWFKVGTTAPPQALPTLFIFYIAQLGISSAVVHRQRKSYFRKSDLLQPWREQSDEEASEVASEPTLVASASRSTTPSKFSPSSIPSRSTTTTKHSSSSFPWILEAEVPFLAAPAFAHHAKLIPSRVIGSLEGLGHRSH